MFGQLSFFAAFAGGLVSFLSPCVLPVMPGFLAYLAGTSLHDAEPRRRETFLASLFFVLGFASVFSVLGVLLNSLLSHGAVDFQMWLARFGGVIIITFGLFLMGLIRVPFFERGHTFRVRRTLNSRNLTSFIFGTAFAAGWTPCVGPVLGSILGLAVASPGSAFGLLFSYSLGLGLPFLVIGFFTSEATSLINRYASATRFITVAFGALLVFIGVLAFTENLGLIANFDFITNYLLVR